MLSKLPLWIMSVISGYLDVAEWVLWYESFERFEVLHPTMATKLEVLDVSDNLFS